MDTEKELLEAMIAYASEVVSWSLQAREVLERIVELQDKKIEHLEKEVNRARATADCLEHELVELAAAPDIRPQDPPLPKTRTDLRLKTSGRQPGGQPA